MRLLSMLTFSAPACAGADADSDTNGSTLVRARARAVAGTSLRNKSIRNSLHKETERKTLPGHTEKGRPQAGPWMPPPR
jgi:hypothetical protein